MELIKESLLKATVFTVAVLGFGLLVGLQVDDARTGFIENQIEESRLEAETLFVTQRYLEESSKNYCEVTRQRIPEIAEENAQIGQDLESFSGKSISNREEYDQLKRSYYVSQLRLYTMLNNYRNRCDTDITLVFFFFDSSIASRRQGSVLTEYRKQVDNDTYVFSYNLKTEKSAVLEILKTDYNVTEGPTVVINGEKTYRRYVPLKELKEILDEGE